MTFRKDFVVFRLPDEKEIQAANLISHQGNDAYVVFHSFDNQRHKKFGLKNKIKYDYLDFQTAEIQPELQFSEITNDENAYEAYIEKCEFFVQQLQSGEFGKLILSRPAVRENFEDIKEKFLQLCQKYPSAFVYLIHFENETWLGASPERLVQINNGILKTVALAGTKAVSEKREWTAKEAKEHQMVIDYIAGSFPSEKKTVRETATIQLGEIQHLQTPIELQIDHNTTTEEICKVLHPTPAVCGLPKEKAMEFILENEGYDRSWYAGYFGLVSKDKSEIFVNLRCAQLFSNHNRVYVGGGLLAESDPEKEWLETELKSRALY